MIEEKLEFKIQEKGDVFNFPYTRRTGKLLTEDALIRLIEKQITSINDEGLKVYSLVIENEKIKRSTPKKLEIDMSPEVA